MMQAQFPFTESIKTSHSHFTVWMYKFTLTLIHNNWSRVVTRVRLLCNGHHTLVDFSKWFTEPITSIHICQWFVCNRGLCYANR